MNPSPLFARASAVSAVLLTLFAGCGSPSNTPDDMGTPDIQVIIDPACDGPAARYRITELHVPTEAEANADAAVGHNVDGTGTTCGVPDFTGGVDNSLIELSSYLTTLNPPDDGVDLQAVIDAALTCPADADPSVCTRLDLILSVNTGTGCAIVEIEDGAGTSLAGPFVGSLDASNHLRAQVASFGLTLPYPTETGLVDVTLDITNVILTATIGATAIDDIVLGGAIPKSSFEELLMELLPLLGGAPTFEDVLPVLANLYDVQVNGECSALSVGFTGSASRMSSSTLGRRRGRTGQKIPPPVLVLWVT